MDEAVSLSKSRIVSDYQKLDYKHHKEWDKEAIGDKIENPGNGVVELRNTHDLLKFFLMSFLFVEPPNCNSPCESHNSDAQIEGSCKLIGATPFGDDDKDRKQNYWYRLTNVLLGAFVDHPIFTHNCWKLPWKHTFAILT
jgi:hypothetical protein